MPLSVDRFFRLAVRPRRQRFGDDNYPARRHMLGNGGRALKDEHEYTEARELTEDALDPDRPPPGARRPMPDDD